MGGLERWVDWNMGGLEYEWIGIWVDWNMGGLEKWGHCRTS